MPGSLYRKTLFRVAGLLVCIGIGGGAPGAGFDSLQEFEKSKKEQGLAIQVNALVDRDSVRPGSDFLLYVVADLEKGWHMYSMVKQSEDETIATRIELKAPEFPPLGDWQETPPRLVRDEVMQKIMKTHSGRVEFSRRFSVPEGLKPGRYALTGTLRFRTCDNRICTLPRRVWFQTHVIVEAGQSR